MLYNDTVISTGSAFPYEHDGRQAIITAWHNLSGRNPNNGECLSKSAAVPNAVEIRYPITRQENGSTFIEWRTGRLELIEYAQDADNATWVSHPRIAEGIDVAALLVSTRGDGEPIPVNSPLLEPALFECRVTGEVYIVGFPMNLKGWGHAPIWKRGNFASDPAYPIRKLPKMVIDTATRQGLSGAPVFAKTPPIWFPPGTTNLDQATLGEAFRFVGIYTSREGDGETYAQLGIAWNETAIIELMDVLPPASGPQVQT